MQAQAAAAGRIARWVLLACTLVGLAAMHSLGHGAAHSAVMSAGHASGVVMSMPAVVEDCPDGHCRQLTGSGPGRHDDLPAWGVCLAVLAGLGITALLAWLLLAVRAGSQAGPPPGRACPGASRAPPRPGVGLRLARASVLRV